MTEKEQAQQYVPDWIRAHSDVWATMVENEQREEEEAATAAAARVDATAAAQGLPVCGPDCADDDAERFYRAFTYWCVPLPAAVSPRFATAWYKLPRPRRLELLARQGAHAAELGGTMLMLAVRLDAPALLQHVPYVRNCKLKIARWLAELAAEFGAVNMLKDLARDAAANGAELCLMIKRLQQIAITGGHLPVLQWLREQRPVSFNESHFISASICGRWPVLEWMRAQDDATAYCPTQCMHAAAAHGHLAFVQRLHREGCPWAPVASSCNVCWAAALNDQFEVLRWAKAAGCPWDQARMATIDLPKGKKHQRMRDWIAAGGEEQEEQEEGRRSAKKARRVV